MTSYPNHHVATLQDYLSEPFTFSSATVLTDDRIAMLFNFSREASAPNESDGVIERGNLVV